MVVIEAVDVCLHLFFGYGLTMPEQWTLAQIEGYDYLFCWDGGRNLSPSSHLRPILGHFVLYSLLFFFSSFNLYSILTSAWILPPLLIAPDPLEVVLLPETHFPRWYTPCFLHAHFLQFFLVNIKKRPEELPSYSRKLVNSVFNWSIEIRRADLSW